MRKVASTPTINVYRMIEVDANGARIFRTFGINIIDMGIS